MPHNAVQRYEKKCIFANFPEEKCACSCVLLIFGQKKTGEMQISLGLTCFQFAFALLLLSSHTRLGLCGKNRKNGNAELKSRAANEIKNVLANFHKERQIGFA